MTKNWNEVIQDLNGTTKELQTKRLEKIEIALERLREMSEIRQYDADLTSDVEYELENYEELAANAYAALQEYKKVLENA